MKTKKTTYALFLTLSACCCGVCSSDKDTPDEVKEEPAIDWSAAANRSSRALISSFWDAQEHYFWDNSYGNKSFGYWPQAHALDVLVDAYERSKSSYYEPYFGWWFDGVWKKNGNQWYNHFFDDMEWIALALLRTYKATGDEKYKDATLELWGYIREGWNDSADGGIAWERVDHIWSKNACSNGPASILAARLYQETGEETYKEWALKIYEWEKNTLFNGSTGAVYDNINGLSGEKNTSWIFTYNQGTFIGAAVELHKITGKKAYLDDAALAAKYTMTVLVTDAILKDEGSGDGGLFKGIFVRYFTELIRQEQLSSDVRKSYVQFLQHNAETLWTEGANSTPVLFGTNWSRSPGARTGLAEQISGCMLIEAMNRIEN
ncbi:MAG: glycosyl hydrolase family 76 [Prevotellaceae bacterium]|jgi:predicted alpha-1,6-mannanase (GH76 family)|nr:glycosyl hydrolase family 76 [Prevotellaceae bacterium]